MATEGGGPDVGTKAGGLGRGAVGVTGSAAQAVESSGLGPAGRAPGVYAQAGSHPGGLPPDGPFLSDIGKDWLPSRLPQRPCSRQAREGNLHPIFSLHEDSGLPTGRAVRLAHAQLAAQNWPAPV